jgi:mannose-6-phosphate isomerase
MPNARIEKPWGWEEILERNERYVIKHIFVRTGARLSLQYHERKHETMMLVSGSAELMLRDGAGIDSYYRMQPGEPYVIAPGTVHRLGGKAFGDADGALVLEVSTPELDDVVRLEDDYGRTP